MKKTIIIIIIAIFISSIAIINFFGLEVKQFEGITYVTNIQCDTATFHGDNSKELQADYKADIPTFIFDFIPPSSSNAYTSDPEDVLKNPNIIQLNYEIFPHLADETGVRFEYDDASGVAVFHELSSSFVFLQPNKILTVTVRATDGSNVSTKVRIMGILN